MAGLDASPLAAVCGGVDEVLANAPANADRCRGERSHMPVPAPTDVLLVARRECIWLHDRAGAASRR